VKHWKWYISACISTDPAVHYWTGTGLASDFSDRVKYFRTRGEAFTEWNHHSESFPGWEAQIICSSQPFESIKEA
jgi:hypothetical protein